MQKKILLYINDCFNSYSRKTETKVLDFFKGKKMKKNIKPIKPIERKKRDRNKALKRRISKLLLKAKKKVIETLLRSSIHGIPTLFSSSSFLLVKLVWLLCFLISWAYFIYLTVILCSSFFRFNVLTRYTVAVESKPFFPGLLIFFLNYHLLFFFNFCYFFSHSHFKSGNNLQLKPVWWQIL